MTGWIRVHRKLQDNEIWLAERFTKGQAWVDILLLANHSPNTYFLRGIEIQLGRGQIGRSVVSLAGRWQWNTRTVTNFLNSLSKRKMIHTKTNNVCTVITVLNYNTYQDSTEQTTQQSTEQSKSKLHTNNNDKNENNKTVPTSKTSLTACTDEELKAIALSIGVSLADVTRTHEIILNKIAAREFKGKTVYHSLRNWILMGIERGTIKVNSRVTPGYRVVNG